MGDLGEYLKRRAMPRALYRLLAEALSASHSFASCRGLSTCGAYAGVRPSMLPDLGGPEFEESEAAGQERDFRV
eukprot:3829782-Pyramimonas_sp.AAC.1